VLTRPDAIQAAKEWSAEKNAQDGGKDSWKSRMWATSKDRTINAMSFLDPEHRQFWGRALQHTLKMLTSKSALSVQGVAQMSKAAPWTGPFIAQHHVFNFKSYGVLPAEDVNSIAWSSHAAVISDANTTLLVERFAADLDLQAPQQDTMPQAKSSKTSGYALKDLLGLQTHSKQVIGECMLNSHKRFCHFVEALVGAEVKLNITLADGQEFPISLSLTKEWVAEVSEISAWLTNLCMHERMLQDRYDRILG